MAESRQADRRHAAGRQDGIEEDATRDAGAWRGRRCKLLVMSTLILGYSEYSTLHRPIVWAVLGVSMGGKEAHTIRASGRAHGGRARALGPCHGTRISRLWFVFRDSTDRIAVRAALRARGIISSSSIIYYNSEITRKYLNT